MDVYMEIYTSKFTRSTRDALNPRDSLRASLVDGVYGGGC